MKFLINVKVCIKLDKTRNEDIQKEQNVYSVNVLEREMDNPLDQKKITDSKNLYFLTIQGDTPR